jgi:hypothetical protein
MEQKEGQPYLPPQPRWKERVDIMQARAVAAPFMDAWFSASRQPEAPLFSGGLLDAWPALDTAAVTVMRQEEDCVRALLLHESTRGPARG